MWHITIKFYNVNMWKLLGFLRVFMLINGSDGLLTVILSLMISRTHCLREHPGVLVSFPCPAISHYVWNNQKPNPSPLGFCHFLQPLPMEVKTVMVLLLSGWTLSAPFSVHSMGAAMEMREHVKLRVKAASAGKGGRPCQKPVAGRWPKDWWTIYVFLSAKGRRD